MAIVKVCKKCGSSDVTDMSPVSWYVETQRWVLNDEGDCNAGLEYCNSCDEAGLGIEDRQIYFQPMLSDNQWRDAHMQVGSVFSSLDRAKCLFPTAEIKHIIGIDELNLVIVE
jgi:hypothetical protein